MRRAPDWWIFSPGASPTSGGISGRKKSNRRRVLVNGRATARWYAAAHGGHGEYLPADAAEPPVDNDYDVLFEDDAILAVDKPGNLPCHPGGRYFHHTLWALIKRRNPWDDIFFVHRLDRRRPGVVLMAKHSRDASALGRQMAGGDFRKRYAALVEGRFPGAHVSAGGVLAPDRTSAIRKKIRFYPLTSPEVPAEGNTAAPLFKLLLRGPRSQPGFRGARHRPAAPDPRNPAGPRYPVVGDKIYGVDETFFDRFIEDRLTDHDRTRLRMNRQALHSAELEFHHPRTGRRLCITAPIPPMFERLASEAP